MIEDQLKSIARESVATLKVEGSRFLASAFPVKSRPAAEEQLEAARRRHYDATHHCFAYRLGTSRDVFRFSDDGEPAGTAGRPILAAIDRLGLSNLIVVVTRYFGGTKLGTGGLMRAYGDTALLVLEQSETVTHFIMEQMVITFPHSQIGNVMRTLSKPGVKIDKTEYDGEVHLRLSVRRSLVREIHGALIEATSGNMRME